MDPVKVVPIKKGADHPDHLQSCLRRLYLIISIILLSTLLYNILSKYLHHNSHRYHDDSQSSFPNPNEFIHGRRSKRDSQIKEKYKHLFEEYYHCTKMKTQVQTMGVSIARALLYEEGERVKLPCNLCTRPDQDIESWNIQWKRKLAMLPIEDNVPIDNKHFHLTPKKNLIILNVTKDHIGTYSCIKFGHDEAVYFVDVVKVAKRKRVYQSGGKVDEEVYTPAELLQENNLLLTTLWSSWTPCSRCDKRGERRKTGTCYVKKIKPHLPVTPRDTDIFKAYPHGVPCQSSLLPPFIANIPQIVAKGSETLLGYCLIPCQALPTIKSFIDIGGKPINVLKSSKAFLSMIEGPPEIPQQVLRKTYYFEEGKPLDLECPRPKTHYREVPVRWQNGSQVIDIIKTYNKTHGRVLVDFKNHFKIRQIRLSDTATYSCYRNNNLAASYKVIVVPATTRGIKDYIMLGSVGFSVFILLIIVCQLVNNRKRKTLL